MVAGSMAQPSVSQGDGITPGRSFGRVKIGMTRNEVTKILGKPESEGLLDGEVTESIWLGSVRKEAGIRSREFVAVYFYKNLVIQVDGTSPRFSTKSGLSTKSSWKQFSEEYPVVTARKRSYPLDDDQPRMFHFAADNAESGFGWIQVQYEAPGIKAVSDDPVDIVVVHRPGTRLIFGLSHMTVWHEPPHGIYPATFNPTSGPTAKNPSAKNPLVKKPLAKKPSTKNGSSTKLTKPDVAPEKPTVVLRVGDASPGLSGSTAAGEKFDLATATKKAKGAVIQFWYLGNEPSQSQLTKLQDVADICGPQGLVVVGVDLGDKIESVRSFLYEKKVRFPVMIDQNGEGAVADFGILSFPTTVIVGASGKIVDIIFGVDDDRFKKALEKLGVTNP